MKKEPHRTLLLILAIVGAMAFTFFLDLELPIGTAGGIIYIVLVLLSLWITDSKVTLILASIASVLTILRSVLVSPVLDSTWMIMLPNRFFILFAIWVTAVLIILRNQADRAVRLVNERFHLATAAINETIYDWDVATNTVVRSEGLSHVTGFKPSEVPPTLNWWRERIHPDDQPAILQIIETALENQLGYVLEYRLQHRDGHYVNIWDRGIIVRDAKGMAKRVIGGSLDVTDRVHVKQELRETNQKLRALIQASPLAIVTINLDGHVSTWNRAAEKIFGWRSDEVISHPPPFVLPEERDNFEKLLASEMAGKSSRGLELKRIRKDGSIVEVALWTAPLRDQAGNIIATLELSEDITQQKRSQEVNSQLAQQLYQTQKLEAVGQLAAGIAHDVNNLLTVILSSVESIGTGTQEVDAHGPLHMIEEAARQATGMTRSLLTFSRRVPAVKKRIDLCEAIRDAEQLLRRLVNGSVKMTLNAPADPVWVDADATQLQQVVLNLAFNARDAMPRGGTLTISVSVVGADLVPEWMKISYPKNSFALLRVSDTGTGIPPDARSNIFEPFFTTKSRSQGTGLGLSIVQSIVKDHGGDIKVESTGSEGTTFRVILPCAVEETSGSSSPSAIPRADGDVLLLADENMYVRQVISSTLKSWGYHIIEAADGAGLLEAFAGHPKVRVVILDQYLGEKDGLEWIKEIRSRDRQIPIILTTAGLRPEEEEALDAKTFILNKPFQISELARLISDVLETDESRQNHSAS